MRVGGGVCVSPWLENIQMKGGLNRMRTKSNSPEVAKGVGGALGGGVAVLDPTHLERLLGHGGGHDAATARHGSDTARWNHTRRSPGVLARRDNIKYRSANKFR